MPPKSVTKSHRKNLRLAYMARRIGEAVTDSEVIAEVCKLYNVQPQTARAELREVYQRWMSIDLENQAGHKAKFMELGFALLNEMRTQLAYGPASTHFKTLAEIAGVRSDKIQVQDGTTPQTGAPPQNTVRSRISELAKNPEIRRKALELGLDLGKVEIVEPEE